MKFSTKLTILFAVTFSIGALASYFIYASSVKLLNDQIEGRLKESARNSMENLERVVFQKYADILYFSWDPVLKSRDSSTGDIQRRLRALNDSNGTYDSISFYSMEGTLLANTVNAAKETVSRSLNRWDSVEKGNEFAMDLSYTDGGNNSLFQFAHLVKDDLGQPRGVIVSRVVFDAIFKVIEESYSGWGIVQIDLVDKNGLILYSNYNKSGILKDTLYDWHSIKERLEEGQRTGTFRHSDGEEEISSYILESGRGDFKGNGWTLVVDIPVAVAFAPAEELRNRVVVILLCAGVLGLLAIKLLAGRISRPIKDLVDASVRVGAGNLDVRVKAEATDETGQLAYAFNGMVNRIKEDRQRLIDYSREIEERRKSLVEAQRIARIGNWELDLITLDFSCSEEVSRIFSGAADWEPSYEGLLSLVNPGDRDSLRERLDNTRATGEPFGMDLRLYLPDGAERIVTMKGEAALFGVDGMASKVAGTIQDITERKKTEDELAIFRRFAEASAQGFGITDLNGVFVYINPALSALSGEGHMDAGGGSILDWRDEETVELLKSEILPAVVSGGKWHGELNIRTCCGNVVPTVETYDLIRDEKGSPHFIAILITDNTDRKCYEEDLKRLATVDRLTKAFNRVKFDEIMKKEIKRSRRSGSPLSLCVFDIDHFKRVNDTFGHGAGDIVLGEVASIVRANIRETDYLIRWGGEEFVIVIPDSGTDGSLNQIDRIRKLIEEHAFEQVGRVTVSFGIAELEDTDCEISLFKRADAALYMAKSRGRNRVEVCGSEDPIMVFSDTSAMREGRQKIA